MPRASGIPAGRKSRSSAQWDRLRRAPCERSACPENPARCSSESHRRPAGSQVRPPDPIPGARTQRFRRGRASSCGQARRGRCSGSRGGARRRPAPTAPCLRNPGPDPAIVAFPGWFPGGGARHRTTAGRAPGEPSPLHPASGSRWSARRRPSPAESRSPRRLSGAWEACAHRSAASAQIRRGL